MRDIPTDSRRARRVQSPVIPYIADLIRRHPGTISLGQGVVHYPPPQAALASLDVFAHSDALHKYQSAHGVSPLLAALSDKLRQDNGIAVSDEHTLMVTAGSNMAFSHAIAAIADPGDEVILLTPFYFNHEMALTLANVNAVCVPTDANYQPRIDWIEAAITPRTRAVVTISPNNPTGAVYPAATLQAINELCRQHGIFHVHDEAYEYFVFDGAKHYSPASRPASAGHTISLFSFSKTYGMASWRVGYLLAPACLADSLRKIQDTVLICAPAVSQYAAAAALTAGRRYAESFLPQYDGVRERVRRMFATLGDRAEIISTEGALYYFARVRTPMSALALTDRLIADYGVAVIPGDTFGATEGCCLRISYGALDVASVDEGIRRLQLGLSDLAK